MRLPFMLEKMAITFSFLLLKATNMETYKERFVVGMQNKLSQNQNSITFQISFIQSSLKQR